MGNNKLLIAGAGSGKTTHIINDALRKNKASILVTTFTQANEEEIKRKFIAIHGCVPSNVQIQTWFSVLLQHGVRPYQGAKSQKKIEGLFLISGQSATGIAETNTANHYFTKDGKIYSDKVAKFAIKCNEQEGSPVINRLSRIYTDIYVDEVQDLAGYDLEFLKLLLASDTNVCLVGDPRQATYSTNDSAKNKQYKKSAIVNFFSDKTIQIETDNTSLNTNYRCNKSICEISNKLYPEFEAVLSGNADTDDHAGLYLVGTQDTAGYLYEFEAMQLRDSAKNKNIDSDYSVMTFGKAKGLEFDRVIIYPTKPFIAWLKGSSTELAPTSRSKLYVAITRAKLSVAFVTDEAIDSHGIMRWENIDSKAIVKA
jgi:DNA helicase-2/ATP-dependent DNA helicase PcrA